MRLAREELRVVLEPRGAVTLAALLADPRELDRKNRKPPAHATREGLTASRSRPALRFSRLGVAQPGVAAAIDEVYDEPDDQPDDEAQPGDKRQRGHQH